MSDHETTIDSGAGASNGAGAEADRRPREDGAGVRADDDRAPRETGVAGSSAASGAPPAADGDGAGATVVPLRPGVDDLPPRPPPRGRVRIRKLRVLLLFLGLSALAAVSTVFGMMMAVASDLPQLEAPPRGNSYIYDRNGTPLGVLTGNEKRIFLKESQIAPVMKHAVIAIEDQRFYTNEGVDLRGIARALYQDIVAKRVVSGGSTITQQYVKNALAAQDDRTVFQKLREAALAYHLTRKWSKERILKNYLNTIYFGNGAYGIEAAARTYFQPSHPGCDEKGHLPCASQLLPHEAALLAGMVSSPSAYDPIAHPAASRARRNYVLDRMLGQGFLTPEQTEDAKAQEIPDRGDLQPPEEDTEFPYFTSWIKQQVVDRLGGGQEGARLAFEGGLRIDTTIDSEMQNAAQAAIDAWLPNPDGPRAALVALDNRSGEVRAMVGGNDYHETPFNLATQGQRQPGSAIKPFILAEALRQGISPNSLWTSRKVSFDVPGSKEVFTVNNYEDAYAGLTTLARATTFSDNSVFAQVGIQVGPRKIARLAERMGIRTPVSSNYAMTLGGLKKGVTPLDMAHAYQTLANDGRLLYGTLSPGAENPRDGVAPGPVGITRITRRSNDDSVELPNGETAVNKKEERAVLERAVAQQVETLLQGPVKYGTGTRAQVGDTVISGKTGTTENYGDAWFVGWTEEYTVAVWVGYPNELRSMEYEFNGEPVAGGTFPAGIFKTFVESILRIYPPKEDEEEDDTDLLEPTTPTPTTPAPEATVAPDTTEPAPAPEETAPPPAEDTAPPPAEEPAPPPEGGGEQAPEAGTTTP
jgi:penicillin-binding protein 1A